jgi:hypothetical protein
VAEAPGKYLPINNANVAEMVSDFVGDAGWRLEGRAAT